MCSIQTFFNEIANNELIMIVDISVKEMNEDRFISKYHYKNFLFFFAAYECIRRLFTVT